MNKYRSYALATIVVGVLILTFGVAAHQGSPNETNKGGPPRFCDGELISESSLLNGLAAGALFPFIDTTPNSILRAHIAITDATSSCAPGAAPPANIQVLAGEAGVSLVNVMTATTNTGIGTATQCVFHVTVKPGSGGVPSTVTDIVVVNGGGAPLTGINTVTATAEVCVPRQPPGLARAETE